MKKLFRFKNIALLLLVALLFSCNKDFLELEPKGKLIAKSTNDYYLLLNNLDLINTGAIAQVAMGDEVAAAEPYFSGAELHRQNLFEWRDTIYLPGEDADELNVTLRNIYTYNKIINEVPNSVGGTEEQKKSIKAEALVGRAWTYFLLINYYGKPYNAASATTDPGFPIIKEANVNETKFSRASVQEVYDFILNDLTTAIPDLPQIITHRIRMAKPTAEAILGKVYMFMGAFDKALPYLKSGLAGIASSAIPVGLYDYNSTFAPGGAFMPIGLFGPSLPSMPNNEENMYGKQAFNYNTFTENDLVITPQTVSLYDSSDLRLKFYAPNAFFGDDYPNGLLRRIGPAAALIGMTVPDLYLLNAECKARLNDLTGAVKDVETLRKNRMPVTKASVPAVIASDQVALVKFILEERVREFAVEGYRWFDMRRLSVDPIYSSTVINKHYLYNADGTIKATFTLKPNRLTLRFPQKIMNQNPGMENNP